MTDQELVEQFKRCEQWHDPVQWELLALAYYQHRYFLNAICYFERADKCRETIVIGVSPLLACADVARQALL